MGKYSLYIKAVSYLPLYKNNFNNEVNGMRMKTTDRSTTYDGAWEKAVFLLRSSTL